jgi:L-lysine exporter family protein LysE/ArgO
MRLDMVLNFFAGIPIGFVMSFALGPVFFSLIHFSLKRGFWSSFYIATGVILADIVLLSAVFSGIELLMPSKNADLHFYVSLLGGLVLIGMGAANFFKKTTIHNVEDSGKRNVFLLILNGFLLNILNPANFLAWLALSTNITQSGSFSFYGQISLYIGCLLGIYATEVAIAYFASLLQRHLNDKRMKIINYTMGIIFVLCGLYLLFQI